MKADFPASGLERVSTRRVVFVHPFSIGADPEVFSPGVYDVETTERPLEASGLTVHVRTSTVLIVPTRAGFRWCEVLESDLEAALVRDASHGAQKIGDAK